MGRQPRNAARRRAGFAGFPFVFHGFHDGWYVLEADMTVPSAHLDALAFEGQVTTWLITQRITPGTWSHFGSGNTGDYPLVFDMDASALCLLLKRPADVLRIAAVFPCTGITIETLAAAVQAEADVHRFIVEDVARIAHDAVRRLYLTFGDAYPIWDDLGGETRVAFILQIQYLLEHPDELPAALHQAWVDRRIKDGWRPGARLSEEHLTDPLLVPWRRLTERAQSRYRLVAATVAALAPMLATQ